VKVTQGGPLNAIQNTECRHAEKGSAFGYLFNGAS
jgi:hypothetical protein